MMVRCKVLGLMSTRQVWRMQTTRPWVVRVVVVVMMLMQDPPKRFIRTVFQSHQNGCKANGNQSGIDGPIPFVAEAIHRCDQSRFPRLTYYFAFFVSQFLCLLHLSYVARLAIVRNFADLWMTKRANDMATTRHSLHHFQHTALHPSIILLSHQRALVDFREKMQGWVSKDSPVLLRDRSVPRSEWCVF